MKNRIIIFIICLCLCGCGNYRELNDMAIITVVAIDKVDDNYELSFLVANSKNTQMTNKEGQAQTTIYSARGKTIMQAAKKIDYRNPKKLYLGHINVVVISEEIGKEGFFDISDFLLRYPETRKQFYLMQTKNCKPKDVLSLVSPLESFPSQHIASLLKSTRDSQSSLQIMDYTSFISKTLQPGIEPTLPVITIVGDEKKGTNTKSLESTNPKAYLKLIQTAIYKNDKFDSYMSLPDSLIYNIITNNTNEIKTTFKYKNMNIGISSDDVKTKVNINDDVIIKVNGKATIAEANSMVNLENPKTITKLKNSLNKSLEQRILKVVNDLQDKRIDIFGFGNYIYKNNPKKWKLLKDDWPLFFSKLRIRVKVDMNISSTGSLDKTAKDGGL